MAICGESHPDVPSGDGKTIRYLIYFQVVHSSVDLGALATRVQTATSTTFGADAWRRHVQALDRFWNEVEGLLDGLYLDPKRTRLYQDGLPVCGHELEIVEEMTRKGSHNHRILLRLHSMGATLMGTESGPLLLQEYNLDKQLLTLDQDNPDSKGLDALQMHAREVLIARDCFIAERINTTLEQGETGILFLGILHDVSPWLNPDIQVLYPLGTPVGANAIGDPSGSRRSVEDH